MVFKLPVLKKNSACPKSLHVDNDSEGWIICKHEVPDRHELEALPSTSYTQLWLGQAGEDMDWEVCHHTAKCFAIVIFLLGEFHSSLEHSKDIGL